VSAVVARNVYANYPPFKNGTEIAVTERKENMIEKGRERFTSLLAVFTVCKRLKKLHRKSRGTPETESANVNSFRDIVFSFFDFSLAHERSLNRYFKGRTTLEAERKNNRNLLFRPVGLEVLSRLYVHFSLRNNIETYRYGLEQLRFRSPGGVFDMILWNSGRIEATAKAKKAAVELCLYLLRELPAKDVMKLTETLRELTKKQNYSLPARLPRLGQ
jgi:DNA sulfur modification protein DndB